MVNGRVLCVVRMIESVETQICIYSLSGKKDSGGCVCFHWLDNDFASSICAGVIFLAISGS